MTNVLGDGFHEKCGQWHKVGQCPLDDVGVARNGYTVDKAQKSTASSISELKVHENSNISNNNFHAYIEEINQKELTISSQKNTRTSLKNSIPDNGVNYFKSRIIIIAVLMLFLFGLINELTSEPVISLIVSFIVSSFVVSTAFDSWEEDENKLIQKQNAVKYKQTYDKISVLDMLIAQNEKTLDKLIEEFNYIKTKNKAWWLDLDGWTFEKEVARVFERQGYVAKPTRGSKDGGVDIYLYKDGKTTIVQCKNHKNQIGPSPVRDVHGAKISERADKAFIVSSSGFSEDAKSYASKNNIELFDINRIIEM